ncbi:hypothetical protein GM3708_3533 (plasmid) [Geminocystis sp. NIES-3708]|uniref:hypothetical protein n=1 Tax=Geminocystis sp. NIES-3708 TaxID=1615909 RepID=UPI0005FCC6DD|nr:hypothetical protein [Geminocystis sp. NIES-3708]BAQ63127.1 hypothetical protein GM3708_3533 [Geminocystis sp. NIES-3708]
MSKPKWKPVVYTRTYEVDFRFITLPNDFDLETKNWLESYISPSMRSVQTKNLSDHPRWVLVKNEQYCLVGVTCLVRDLISSSEENQEYTQDTCGRPVYGFFGYVCEMDNMFENDDFDIPSKIMSNFESLFNYVKDEWFLKSYQINQRQTEESESIVIETNKQSHQLVYENNFQNQDEVVFEKLNYPNEKTTKLWNVKNNEKLWKSANNLNQNVSLCLNLANESDLINSPFLNATVLDIQEDKELIINNQKKQIKLQNLGEIDNGLEQQNNNWNEEFNKSNLRGNEQDFVQTPRHKTRNYDLDSEQYTENNKFGNYSEKNGISNIVDSIVDVGVDVGNVVYGILTDKRTTMEINEYIFKAKEYLEETKKLYYDKEKNLTEKQKLICQEKLGDSQKIIRSVERDATNVAWKLQHPNPKKGIKILDQRIEEAINYISEVNSILTNKNPRLGLKQKEQSQDSEQNQSIWDF